MRFASTLFAVLALGAVAQAQSRSWNHLPTGNGHGFQVYDRQQHRIVDFLEHPYRYVAPGAADRTWGVGRRDLAHDIYFGVRIDGTTTWLDDQRDVEYEAQSHVIHAWSTQGGVRTDTYYFAPFGYGGNGMVMLVRATNEGGAPATVSFFVKPNLSLGSTGGSRTDPGNDGEQIQWNGSATPPHGVETGPGGGHAVYVPIGGVDRAGCGGDSAVYAAAMTGSLPTTATCNAANQVLVMQRDATIAPGESAWWGAAILFVNDDPREPQAADFRDERSVADILALWTAFAADRSPQAIHDDALAEMDGWRTATAPAALTDQERILWRQSESILRMGQVREPRQSNRENDGMVLAALPPGEWHTGWVRDAQYGIVSYAMTGHTSEARLGLEFFLGADGATNGFFQQSQYLGAPYRVSVTRYFGNGKEEGDFNSDGPNIETDGWGLVLWAARMYLHYSCDLAWLDAPTWRGDTMYEALETVASDIEEQMRGGLPGPDASIWEVHWNRRQVFAYTAATQIRGLLDFADIADAYGRTDRGTHFRELARSMLEASTGALVYRPQNSFASHLGVSSSPVHVDGSTVEFFNWGLVDAASPLTMGTLNNYSRLVTGFGGYQRLEPMLSLTGEGSASAYDVSEWVLLDLRIGQAWRRAGRPELADALIDKVTMHASVNDFLIPELFDRSNGRYTGVVPMVGYGAGAWMMEQLDRHGQPAPRYDATFVHCSEMPPDGGVPGTDGGVRPGTDGGVGPGEDGGGVGPGLDDRRAVLCSTGGGSGSVPAALLVFAALAALAIRRRR